MKHERSTLSAVRGGYTVQNGHAHTSKQRYLCRVSGYQFTLEPTWQCISS